MSWLCKIHCFCTSTYIFLVRIKSISHLNKFSSSTAYYLNSEFSMLIIIIYIATRSISHERGEKCFNRWRTKRCCGPIYVYIVVLRFCLVQYYLIILQFPTHTRLHLLIHCLIHVFRVTPMRLFSWEM